MEANWPSHYITVTMYDGLQTSLATVFAAMSRHRDELEIRCLSTRAKPLSRMYLFSSSTKLFASPSSVGSESVGYFFWPWLKQWLGDLKYHAWGRFYKDCSCLNLHVWNLLSCFQLGCDNWKSIQSGIPHVSWDSSWECKSLINTLL